MRGLSDDDMRGTGQAERTYVASDERSKRRFLSTVGSKYALARAAITYGC